MGLLVAILGSKIGRQALIVVLILAAVGLVCLRIFAAGQARERAKAAQATIDALRKRVQVDDEISKLDPSARRERLRKWMRNDESE